MECSSRLYRSRFLKVQTHFATFFEIYKICTLLHRSKIKFLANFDFFLSFRRTLTNISQNLPNVGRTLTNFDELDFRTCLNLAKYWQRFVPLPAKKSPYTWTLSAARVPHSGNAEEHLDDVPESCVQQPAEHLPPTALPGISKTAGGARRLCSVSGRRISSSRHDIISHLDFGPSFSKTVMISL